MNEATLRMFNGIITRNTKVGIDQYDYEQFTKGTLKKGYLVDPAIFRETSVKQLSKLFSDIEKHVVTFENWNKAFYTSWSKIEKLTDFELYVDQLLHYLTTYGFEAMGIESNFIYYPEGKINLPVFTKDVKFLYVRALDGKEIIEKLDKLMSSGLALKPKTQEDIVTILHGFSEEVRTPLMINCKNKELNSKFALEFNIFPQDPKEFLRMLIEISTGNSLLIKNPATISAIKMGDNEDKIFTAFFTYKKTFGLETLAHSFNRFKPLWLAFKSYDLLKPEINKIRKLAKKHHKPMKADLLNDITAMISRRDSIPAAEFYNALHKASNFRKIRLLYALENMKDRHSEVVYKIRNGKSYATTRDLSKFDSRVLESTIMLTREALVMSLEKKLGGQFVKLDSNLIYALPATEKQFLGSIPSGSYVEITGDAVVGIHWKNIEDERVDLDLSLIDMGGAKLGWDGSYRNSGVMFSGDVTDAPDEGASEFFYFRGIEDGTYLLNLNYYNAMDDEAPFDLIVGSFDGEKIPLNYVMDPNKIAFQTSSKVKEAKVLGLVKVEEGKAKFYFSEANVGSQRSSTASEAAMIQLQFLKNSLKNMIPLRDILLEAGATLITLPSDLVKCDIDLTANNLEKDTILSLFY